MSDGETVTTSQAAAILAVPAGTIAVWKTRGRITPAGYVRPIGRCPDVPVFWLSDLRPLADRHHKQQRRRAAGRP